MRGRKLNPRRAKLHTGYNAKELADCLQVHPNTVQNWRKAGLKPIDGSRPALFRGSEVREFLKHRMAARKRPCPPGTLFCMTCKEPRRPALDMVDYIEFNERFGSLRAICECCERVTCRRAVKADLGRTMPGLNIQFQKR